MFKYSYNSLVYYGEDVRSSIERVAKYGYDAIELVGEPQDYDTTEVRRLCEEKNISVSSICSIYTSGRDLASPDPAIRKDAVDYVKRVADFSAEVGSPVMIVAPTACMKTSGWGSPEEEMEWAVESIGHGAEYAGSVGVGLTIEAWNRYETYFLNRLSQCVELLHRVGMPNLGVMGDTFHMNLEEASIAGAFRETGRFLTHVHFADSNRAAPGRGHIDFKPILQSLAEIGYKGYISFELLPPHADPFGTLKRGGGREFFDEYTKQAIEHIRAIEEEIS
jgi:sugar phosphate isomerase/epimerase